MNQIAGAKPWLKEGRTAYQRAIALIDHARELGLSGKVLAAVDLRVNLIATIEQHASERAGAAEKRLLADGYQRCAHCDEWTFGEDALRSSVDDGVYCPDKGCRDTAEPLCACGCGFRLLADGDVPESCAARIARNERADAFERACDMGVA